MRKIFSFSKRIKLYYNNTGYHNHRYYAEVVLKFYNRENELTLLRKADTQKSSGGIMSMLYGRRRVGKTTLALQNYTDDPVLYFFVSKKSEPLLCEEFLEEIHVRLGVRPVGTVSQFEQLFRYLLELSESKTFTVILDEFQEFYKVNDAVYSIMQKLWDRNKASSRMHLICCGSVFSLIRKIFEDQEEPLFGRCDYKIHLKPLKVSVLSEILADYTGDGTANLLDFYIFTGGIAKYIELFALYNAFNADSIIETIISPNSLFLEEGRARLVEEFGKEYGLYFSILSLIASSKTSRSEIESILERNVSGHLHRLEHDYSIIRSIKPFDAKPNAKIQKYEIVDNFLSFWFRFVYKYQSLVEAENFTRLREIVQRDLNMFRGKFLEKLFVELLKEKQKYTRIGSYWERGNRNEIDIVAVDDIDKEILFCEVKLSAERLGEAALKEKTAKLIEKYKEYTVRYELLSPDDIGRYLTQVKHPNPETE